MRDLKDFFRVGFVTKPHGVGGEVYVYPTTDDIRRFDDLGEVLAVCAGKEKSLFIERVKYFKNMVILKFESVNSMNEAELLRRYDLYVDRAHAVSLEENEYFIADLIGMDVYKDNGDFLGTLMDVLQTGANDVYSVMTPQKKEILLPAIPECVLDIDMEKSVITVHVLKGLLED